MISFNIETWYDDQGCILTSLLTLKSYLNYRIVCLKKYALKKMKLRLLKFEKKKKVRLKIYKKMCLKSIFFVNVH